MGINTDLNFLSYLTFLFPGHEPVTSDIEYVYRGNYRGTSSVYRVSILEVYVQYRFECNADMPEVCFSFMME